MRVGKKELAKLSKEEEKTIEEKGLRRKRLWTTSSRKKI